MKRTIELFDTDRSHRVGKIVNKSVLTSSKLLDISQPSPKPTVQLRPYSSQAVSWQERRDRYNHQTVKGVLAVATLIALRFASETNATQPNTNVFPQNPVIGNVLSGQPVEVMRATNGDIIKFVNDPNNPNNPR